MDSLINYLFIILPEFYIINLISISLLGYKFSRQNILLIYISAISASIWILIPFPEFLTILKVIIVSLCNLLLLKIFLKTEWNKCFYISVVVLGILCVFNIIVYSIYLHYSLNNTLQNSLISSMIIMYIGFTILIIGILIANKKKNFFLNYEEKLINNKLVDKKITKIWFYAFIGIFIQMVLLILFYGTFFEELNFNHTFDFRKHFMIISICVITLILNIIVITLIINIKEYTEKTSKNDDELKNNENLHKLIKKLRMERHDNISQIQAIYGLVNEKSYDTLKLYLENLVDNIKTSPMSSAYSIKNTPVCALLNTKIEQNAKDGIKLKVVSETSEDFSQIREIDLVKIISNIYDNASRVLVENKTEDPCIEIFWGKEDNNAVITISNNGPKINKKLIDLIFVSGYTTKVDSEDSGYGLAIVKEIVIKYKGKIFVNSSKELTAFTIKIPLEE